MMVKTIMKDRNLIIASLIMLAMFLSTCCTKTSLIDINEPVSRILISKNNYSIHCSSEILDVKLDSLGIIYKVTSEGIYQNTYRDFLGTPGKSKVKLNMDISICSTSELEWDNLLDSLCTDFKPTLDDFSSNKWHFFKDSKCPLLLIEYSEPDITNSKSSFANLYSEDLTIKIELTNLDSDVPLNNVVLDFMRNDLVITNKSDTLTYVTKKIFDLNNTEFCRK